MVDTIRTKAELNNLFTPNTTGAVSSQSIRDMLVSMNVHAQIGGANVAMNLGTAWQKVPLDVEGEFVRGFTVDLPNNRIMDAPCRLVASVAIEVHMDSISAGNVDFAAFVNGVQSAHTRRNNFTLMTFASSWSAGVQLEQGDDIELRARGSEAGININLNRAALTVVRVGVE